jgi:Na+/proline symporter
VAGIAYLGFGLIPVGLGLAARLLAPESEQAILPLLADLLLSPALVALFTLALASAVLSTIDSAILAPSSVLAQNVLPRLPLGRIESLRLNQLCVIGVAAISLAIAQVGESAYGLLESAYEIGLVSLLVPLALGLYEQRRGERAALVSMVTGTSLWTLHRVLGWEWFAGPLLEPLGLTLPMGLSCAALALGAYLLAEPNPRRVRR